jgi:phosphoribosyl-ATP pyrophosphohydrolase/phosphoribosyl-AMP cyclohydrolase
LININELNFSKLNGLIPAIVVDNNTGQILMLGFMNKESLEKTIQTKFLTFYSRNQKKLWTKGETSGNYLNLIKIKADCDNDSLLIYAEPKGPTCHTGEYSCFGLEKASSLKFLNELFGLIKERKNELPENSYTTKLFKEGENRIIQKVGEESVEVLIASKNKDKNEIINEVSDLIYHLFVLLAEKEIEFSEVVSNLESRHKK